MKKILILSALFLSTLFTGCFESTQELTIAENGGGEMANKIDMSSVMAMLKQMGGTGKDKLIFDTTLAFKDILDSVEGLTADDKAILKNGTLALTINTEDEKLLITTKMPFSNPGEMKKLREVMEKWGKNGGMSKIAAKAFGEKPGMDEMGINEGKAGENDPLSSVAEMYFNLDYSKGKIERSLIKDKYAKLSEDESLSKLREMGEMGSPVKSNFVINLPSPVKSYKGKNVKLSDDKKKVTVETTLDDLYDDPSKFEFKIEY